MLRGSFELIGDKSISHRAIMFSSISKGNIKISNFLMGQDCLSTIDCFRKMGVSIDIDKDFVYVKGSGLYGLKKPTSILDVGNSGTTIRLISGILAGNEFKSTIVGDESISKRPMRRVTEPLRLMGSNIVGEDNGNYTPLTISGGNLKGIEYDLKVSSAQVKSALILAGLYADGETKLTGKIQSRDHTEIMLKSFGANIETNKNEIIINKVDELYSEDICVPGDISSAAFVIVGTLITKGSEVLIKNVGLNESRTGIIDVVKLMNGNIEIVDEKNVGGEKVGDLLVKYSPEIKAITIDKDIIPRLIDEIPIISILATQAEGTTIIKDAKELKIKESNRIKAMVDNLKSVGVKIDELDDGMIIYGKSKILGGEIDTYKDHRIAMSFAIANLISEGEIKIDDTKCIDISFPGFFELIKKLSI